MGFVCLGILLLVLYNWFKMMMMMMPPLFLFVPLDDNTLITACLRESLHASIHQLNSVGQFRATS
jgi:hypothetical protein